ncbi:hypothetical protein [Flavobacterium pallidum]|uniref:Uncharacterized protein n=1 Tax=Flavobacterium pallidum TaxID=2172098 RepID=A0A2S1SE05_9FLAO|nr:hypothetical protein [Flavobacterium pallidum]AWI24630.1 hypothetical protein HYN49_01280 [Flavobacterium pallidum]
MNTFNKLILLCLLAISNSGNAQQSVAVTFTLQDVASLERYLSEQGVAFRATDLVTLKNFNAFANYNKQDKLSVPEIYFFNREGFMVRNRFNKNECTEVIGDIDKINAMKAIRTEKLSAWLSQIAVSEGNDTQTSPDCTIIIDWAVFAGKEMNAQAFEWYREINKQKANGRKIKCYLLNLDLQQSWNLTDNQKKALGIGE